LGSGGKELARENIEERDMQNEAMKHHHKW
jgi:hypothetical protein